MMMATTTNESFAVLAQFFSLDALLNLFDSSAFPEFVAVGLTVVGGLGTGILTMLVAFVVLDLLGTNLEWWEKRHAFEDWLAPQASLGAD